MIQSQMKREVYYMWSQASLFNLLARWFIFGKSFRIRENGTYRHSDGRKEKIITAHQNLTLQNT